MLDEDLEGFCPEDVVVISRAFASCCYALRFAIEYNADPLRAEEIRTELARKVIDAAKSGERHPLRLTQRALAAMPAMQAAWQNGQI
jgi:hypothetical protein